MMPLLQKIQYAAHQGPPPRRQAAELAAMKLIAGQDTLISGKMLNINRGLTVGKASLSFMEEFSTRNHPMFIFFVNPAMNTQWDFIIADLVHDFIDPYNVSVNFVMKISSNNPELASTASICLGTSPNGINAENRIVAVSVEAAFETMRTLNSIFAPIGGIMSQDMANLLFHDQVVDQLVISELMLRGIPIKAEGDHRLVKCLVSPAPTYSMLFAFGDLDISTRQEITAELGLHSEFEVITGSASVDGMRAMTERNAQVIAAAKRRVSAFLASVGISCLDEIMPRERADSVTNEIIGMSQDSADCTQTSN